MKKVCMILITSLAASGGYADIPLPPDQQLAQNTAWKNAVCKDVKNLVTCSGNYRDDKPSGCNQYNSNSKKYQWLARKGRGSFFEEKYCLKVGLDK